MGVKNCGRRRFSQFMTTLLVSQRNFDSHVTPTGHPERAERLRAIERELAAPAFAELKRKDAPSGDIGLAALVNGYGFLEILQRARPAEGIAQIDEDTFISATSLDASAT